MSIKLVMATLILPAIMEISGLLMMLHPPKERNLWFGYRSKRSLLSKATWDFANYYCGTLYVYLGFYIVTATLLTDILLRIVGLGIRGAGTAVIIIVLIQTFCFIFPVFFVESKLKLNFDKEGNLINLALDEKPSKSYDDSDWDDWKRDEWKDEWKEAWHDEFNDWELWKQMKDAEIAEKRRLEREKSERETRCSGAQEFEEAQSDESKQQDCEKE